MAATIADEKLENLRNLYRKDLKYALQLLHDRQAEVLAVIEELIKWRKGTWQSH